jgi:hypothetical protein
MATTIKTPRKKKTVRLAPVKKTAKNTISFADWEDMDGAAYHRRVQNLRSELYDNNKPADLAPEVLAWMKENGYNVSDINAVKKRGPGVVLGITCKLLRSGMPDLNPKHKEYWESLPGTSGTMKPHSEWVRKTLEEAITIGHTMVEEAKVEDAESAGKYVPTIQERIRDQSVAMAEPIDEWLEGFITDKAGFDPKGFDFKTHFQKTGVTQAHARKLKEFFARELLDFDELERMPTAAQLKKMDEREVDQWEQLKEGYSHIKKTDINKYRIAIEGLMEALDFVIDQSKAVRKPRKAKPKSADRVVAKVKYLKVDEKYKLTSVNPVDIVGASELWVFNVKTRKLGKYVAASIDPKGMGRDGSGLSVKGASIAGFDENLSIQKTLRKPEEQLKEFKAAGKVALRKFLDDIKTTDTKLNGRINADTILLKIA